ncbi:MAG: hypothetical protein QM598_12190 [Protaetiibacter sp.]
MCTLARDLAVPLVIAALALSACAADPEPAASTPPPAASRAPSPTPTPTRPALDELVLEPGGLGYIRIGSPVPEVDPALAIVEWDGTACQWDGYPAEGEPYVGYWRSVYPADSTANWPDNQDPYFLLTHGGLVGGAVTLIQAHWGVTTAEGIGPGSTRAALIAAYGSALQASDHGSITTLYSLTEGSHRIVFEVADDTGDGYWEPRFVDQVMWMWAESDDRALYGIAGSDTGGPCPA